MNKETVISGRLVKGAGKAAFFTGLDWVMAQCKEKLGFIPFPGTLNLEMDEAAIRAIDALPDEQWEEFIPPDQSFCSSRVLAVMAGPVRAALIRPSFEVNIHGRHVVELLAPVCLRQVLALADGAPVEVSLCGKSKAVLPLLSLKGVLFDLDGTLIDSIESYYRIVEIAVDRLGLPKVPRPEILNAARNDSFQWDLILKPAPGKSLEQMKQEAWKIIETLYPQMFLKNVRPFPQTGAVLRLLHDRGIRMGIVTSTPQKNIKDKMSILDQCRAADLMDAVISAGDAGRKKPYPDHLILCMENMGLSADACAYVGDTATDIIAGRAAGMKTVGVLTGFDSRGDLEDKSPDHVLESIAELPRIMDLY